MLNASQYLCSVCMCELMKLLYISLCILVMLNAAQYVLFWCYKSQYVLYILINLFMFEINFIKLHQAFVLFFTPFFSSSVINYSSITRLFMGTLYVRKLQSSMYNYQLHVYCDINDIVSGYLIGAKINPYISYRWYEVSKNGTTL